MTKLAGIISTVVAISVGLIVLASFFVPSGTPPLTPSLQSGLVVINTLATLFIEWAMIVAAFALILGIFNLLNVHGNKIKTQAGSWFYSIVLILSFIITLGLGVYGGGPNSDIGVSIFNYILRPLESTLFALMAFFIISAAYRTFRIRDFETFLMVTAAIIVLLGQVPAGYQLWADFPHMVEWGMNVPVLAGVRGILLGTALGTIATGLRIILGADRPYIDTEGHYKNE